MIIGLPMMSAMGWRLCKLSNTVATPTGSILPVHQANGHHVRTDDLFLYWPPSTSTIVHYSETPVVPRAGVFATGDTGIVGTQTSGQASTESPRPPPEPNDLKAPLFTRKELSEIHARSGHPTWRRMHDFLHRVRPNRCPENVRQTLQSIVGNCKACAIYGAPPRRVRVAFRHEHGKFNEEVIVDVFSLNSRPVLSIIDRDTRFLSCVFLHRLTAAAIWDGILRGWSLKYLGHPKVVRTDEGSNFVAAEVQLRAGEASVVLHAVGVETASSMGLGEQIHYPLRRSYLKLRSENPRFSDELLLNVVVKAHNDSGGLNGIVPTVRVFGAFPRLPVRTGPIVCPATLLAHACSRVPWLSSARPLMRCVWRLR